MARDWIDISVPLRRGTVVWPGDAPVRIDRTADMEKGASCTMSALALGSHTGTHMDAPLHFLRRGASMSRLPLLAVIGRARVIEILDPRAVRPEEVRRHRIRRGERIIFRTRNSHRPWADRPFRKRYVHLTPEAARLLADRGVRTVGIDYLSVGAFGEGGRETHRILLGAGIWIIEGLDLTRVRPGRYELVCLPLRVEGIEGAPARAVIRPAPGR